MGCWNGDEADLRRCLGQALVASSEKAAHVGAKHGHVGLIKVVTLDLVKDGLSATQPDAPRQWKWRVRGDKQLLMTPKGHGAKQHVLELSHSYDGDILTIEWTGRATNRGALRRKEGWAEDIAYPVAIDPTINESICGWE